jgi:hypothetical protein
MHNTSFSLTYEGPISCSVYIRLERLAKDKHISQLSPFLSYKVL